MAQDDLFPDAEGQCGAGGVDLREGAQGEEWDELSGVEHFPDGNWRGRQPLRLAQQAMQAKESSICQG